MAVAWPAYTCPRCAAARAEGHSCSRCGLLPAADGVGWELAGLGRRLAGAALFGLVAIVTLAALMVLLAALVVTALGDATELTEGGALALLTALLTPGTGYLAWWLVVAPQGQTPVKQVLGMRVVRRDGTVAGLGTMLVRSVLGGGVLNYIVPFYWLVDACWVLWDRDRQCLHDKVAGTLVVLAQPVALPASVTAGHLVKETLRRCPACGSGLTTGARYCIECGVAVTRTM